MANTIKIKRSTTTNSPTSLAEGELAYSETSKKLFIGDSGGNIKTIGGVAADYLPEASSTVLGAIKVGDNLTITDGVLDAEAGIGVKGADIASASSITIPAAGDYFDVTGTTTITQIVVDADRHFTLQFDSGLTLTYNSTSLILPFGSSNIQTSTGDVATFQSTNDNEVKCLNYQAQSGSPLSWPKTTLLTDHSGGISGTADRLIFQDSTDGTPKRKHINEFSLSQFSNDLGWNAYSLPAAGTTSNDLGGVYVPSSGGINVSTSGATAGQITLNYATSTQKGAIELFSDTDQSVAANAVTSTAGRTYGIQLNSANQAVVNVPWVDTDTTYTAGTGLTLTGTEFSVSSLALTSVQTAASETAQLALTTEEGDVVIRSDENKSYIHNGGTAGTMADFTLLSTPTSDITSITTSDSIDGGGTAGVVDIGHKTGEGHRHIPSGGSVGQFLMRHPSIAGMGYWASDNNTQYSAGTGLDLTGTTFSIESDYDLSSFNDDISATGGSDWQQSTGESAQSKLVKRDSTGRIFVNEIWIGYNNGGDTSIEFYDDLNNTAREFKWDSSDEEFQLETSAGTMAAVTHADSTIDGGTF